MPGPVWLPLEVAGHDGNDVLQGGWRNDRLEGGAGRDKAAYSTHQPVELANCGAGADRAAVDPDDTVIDCETLPL